MRLILWWLHGQGQLHCWKIVGSTANHLFTWTEHWPKELFQYPNQSSYWGWNIHKLIIMMPHHIYPQTCMEDMYCFDSPCNTLIIVFAKMHKHLTIIPCDDFKQNLGFSLLPCSNFNLLQNTCSTSHKQHQPNLHIQVKQYFCTVQSSLSSGLVLLDMKQIVL